MNPTESQEISIRLEGYDDIYSDFDARPYSKRALSVDFLEEIKRASYDKNDEGIELTLHIPADKRNEADEAVINQRLRTHFKRHQLMLSKEKRGILQRGTIMVLLGIISMIAATFVAYEDTTKDLLHSFLLIFLEPAAWFLLWEGMDLIIFHSKSINPELSFYRKMASEDCKINYVTYTA